MRATYSVRTRPPEIGVTAASLRRCPSSSLQYRGFMGFASVVGYQQQEQQFSSSSNSLACPAYVGQQNSLAGEYHSKDFDWHDHAQRTANLVEKQWAAAPAAVRQAAQLSEDTGQPLAAVASFLQNLQQRTTSSGVGDSSSQEARASGVPGLEQGPAGLPVCAEAAVRRHQQGFCSSAAQQQQHRPQQQVGQLELQQQHVQQIAEDATPAPVPGLPAAACEQPDSSNEWEVFYRAHPSARFYKERRYLLLEFPCLAPPAQLQHIVEVGAGCGSSILPVRRAQPQAQVTVCDVSATCLEQLQGAMQLLGLEPQRCRSFVADGTDPGLAQQLAGCCADVALIMFTLSAVEPAGMLAMLRNAAASLRPGGLLCVRDHALYDMVQLRIPPEQCIGRHIYRRGDGTLAYFYTTQELAGLAAAAGLEVVECEYVCVFNRNRKTGLELRRTFVHGVFRRPQLLW